MIRRRLLGREAATLLDSGPAYYEEGGKLIWALFDHEEERDPAAEIAALRQRNAQQLPAAETATRTGEWHPLALIMARERLIAAIAAAFSIDIHGAEEEEPGDAD